MYRINDEQAAIREIQRYLVLIGTPEIPVVTTGIYDDNTRASVTDFQKKNGAVADGVVNRETFEMLYEAFLLQEKINEVNNSIGSFFDFPLKIGDMSEEMFGINTTLARLLDHYGYTHNLRSSRYFSRETARSVAEIRKIYKLTYGEEIDEILYYRMIRDHDSIYG